jgi:hypothetical protein
MGKNSGEKLPMRTAKKLDINDRIIYHPELCGCIHCGGGLKLYNYLSWDKTVQTLDGVYSIASRPAHCIDPACPGYTIRMLSAEGQQIALPGSTYGYDVLTRIGWFRQEWRATYSEIQSELSGRVDISALHVRHLYNHAYLPLLACNERQHRDKLRQAVNDHQGLLIGLDGLAPEGGEPQLWFIRELLTGLTLRSGWLSRQDQATFEAFLAPLKELPGPVLAVLSDKQRGLVPAVAEVLPDSPHQFCQSHYLKNLAEPLSEADEAFKVEFRKTIRQELGSIIRSEKTDRISDGGVLTVTGLLPTPLEAEEQSTTEADSSIVTDSVKDSRHSECQEVQQIITGLTRRMRYLLTLKGRPPFGLAGIEMYQRFREIANFMEELLTHRHEPSLALIAQGIQSTLTRFANSYQELQQGADWLQDIASILDTDQESSTSQQVAQQLQSYLDNLLELQNLSPRLQTIRKHLYKVSSSYWPGLFYCYDIAALPRTNNDLESRFRDTKRRLLRTSGQKGQTSRTLQRSGAWELLPRPPSEEQSLKLLRQIEQTDLRQEQQRLQQHQKRFQFHTRSQRRANYQLDKLKQRWTALPYIDTG